MGIDENYSERPFFATWWFEGLILLFCLAGAWLLWQYINAPWMQNAVVSNQFIELARSLAQGHGYTLVEGGQHVPYLATPPLYPLLLAGIMLVAGTTSMHALAGPFMGLDFCLYLGSVLLVYNFISHRIRKPYSYLVTLLYTVSPLTLSAVKSMTPEMAYLVCSLLAMVAIDKYFVEKGSGVRRWQVVWCCLWVVAAMLTKNLGISLMLAFFILSWYRLGTKRAFVTLGTVLIILSPWFLRDIIHRNFADAVASPIHQSLTTQYTLSSPFTQPKSFTGQLLRNADAAMAEMTHATIGSLNFEYMRSPVTRQLRMDEMEFRFADIPAVRWTLGALVLLGVFIGFYQYSGIGSTYLLTFLTTTLFLPLEGHLSIFPVLPLLLFFLFNAVMWLGRGAKKILHLPLTKVAVPVLTLLILFNSLNSHLQSMHRERVMAVSRPIFTEKGLTETPRNSNYLRAMRWLRTNTPQEARVISPKPEDVRLFSQRRGQPLTPPPRHGRTQFEEGDYVVEDRNDDHSRRHLAPLIDTPGTHAVLVYNDPEFRIWKVLSTPTLSQAH